MDGTDAPNDARDAEGPLDGVAFADAMADGASAPPILIFPTGPLRGDFGIRTDQVRAFSGLHCSEDAAGLGVGMAGRSFVAILCATEADDVAHLPRHGFPGDRPIETLEGAPVADHWADLLDGPDATLAALGVVGERFWTGCNEDGTTGLNCSDWSLFLGAEFGWMGSGSTPGASWLSPSPRRCEGELPILCLSW
jgi:hypothetical protein